MSKDLYSRYLEIKSQAKNQFSDSLAKQLGVSPLDLAIARLGHGTQLLDAPAKDILKAVGEVGEVLAVTKNDYAVHEMHGEYHNVRISSDSGIVLNQGGIDLRLFMSEWHSTFEITEETPHGVLTSLQFFNAQGSAIHKIYRTAHTKGSAWDHLITQFKSEYATPTAPTGQQTSSATQQLNQTALAESLITDWEAMSDVHQFNGILKKHHLTRRAAFALVPPKLAYRVSNHSLVDLVNRVQQDQNEIMLFIGNSGIVQIFSGKIEKTSVRDQWFNILNEKFNLHFNESAVLESWMVSKPTRDGWLHSLELIGPDDKQLGVMYGMRHEGQPEQQQWQAQVTALPPLEKE